MRIVTFLPLASLTLIMLLAACQKGGPGAAGVPGDTDDTRPFAAINAVETVHFGGTEPFWGGQVSGPVLTYSTPDNTSGETIAVERFAGRGGVSFTGERSGAPFTLMITEGACSDGMSDRTYPFNATLKLGEEVRKGCAWTDARGFDGPEHP